MSRRAPGGERFAPASLLALLAVAACGGKPQAAAGPARSPRAVSLVAVRTEQVPRRVAVTGVLAAQDELVLALDVGGRLAELSVDVGDPVPAGAPIAKLDPRDFDLAVERAEAAVVAAFARLGLPPGGALDAFEVDKAAPVREAKAVLDDAQLQRDRMASMVQEKLRPAAELDTADATLAVAHSKLQTARDDVTTWLAEARLAQVEARQAEKRRSDSRLVAPWAGRVASRVATAGQVLAAGAPVVTLLRVDPLRLRLRVPELAVAQLANGQDVEFTIDGGDGKVQHGRVVRLGADIERGDRTRLVEAEVQNGDARLLPGAFCRAEIITVAAEPRLVVPASAVASFAGVDRVFTVEAGKDGTTVAKGLVVQVGARLPGEGAAGDVVLLGGATAGLQVVRDALGLFPGQAVRVGE